MLEDRFEAFESGIQTIAVITGTASIGKTMFALYAARYYFQKGELVVLYHANKFWAFTKTDPTKLAIDPEEQDLDLHLILQQDTNAAPSFWYTTGGDQSLSLALETLKRSGCAVMIRDSGGATKMDLLESAGRELYIVSSGQEEILGMIRKTGIPDTINQRHMELWSGEEFKYAVKLGLLSTGASSQLDLDYIMEGYRRYGGSVRMVVTFAKSLQQSRTPKENISKVALPDDTAAGITKIAEMQFSGQEEATKTRAVLFHRSPVGTGYKVHFASHYLGQYLMNQVQASNMKALRSVVGALSITTGHQDAYGVLYEEEVHKRLFAMPSFAANITVTLLGCHGLSQEVVKHRIAKSEMSLDFARASVVHFPGKSLGNIYLECEDNLFGTYFHPLTPNFPTHDSFVICKASDFFEAYPQSRPKDREAMEATLTSSVVVVGLQMTVTGSNNAIDKPSHSVQGAQLKNHLKDMKYILGRSHPGIQVLDDLVTIFISPTESCRKMDYMPVLTTTESKLQTAIPNFAGMAPQYYAVLQVPIIADLLLSSANDVE